MAEQDTNSVGSLNVEVKANIDPLKAGLREAQGVAQVAGAQIENSVAEKPRGAFKRLADGIKGVTGGVVALRGAIFSIVGVVSSIALAWTAVSRVIQAIGGYINNWQKDLDRISAAAAKQREDFAAIAAETEKINREAAKNRGAADSADAVRQAERSVKASEARKLIEDRVVKATQDRAIATREIERIEGNIARLSKVISENLVDRGGDSPRNRRALQDEQRELAAARRRLEIIDRELSRSRQAITDLQVAGENLVESVRQQNHSKEMERIRQQNEERLRGVREAQQAQAAPFSGLSLSGSSREVLNTLRTIERNTRPRLESRN